MSTSLENYCEAIAVILLKASSGLTAIIPSASIVRQDEDSAATKDRIVCKASPREPEMFGPNNLTVKVWRVPVDVTIHFVTRDVADMDTAIAELTTAMNTSQAAAVTLAGTAGVRRIEDTEQGDRDTQDDERTRTKQFVFFAEPV